MSQETLATLQQLQTSDAVLQMTFNCAPLITGMKESNLINVSSAEFRTILNILRGTDIRWFILRNERNRITVLLYREIPLCRYLAIPAVRDLLHTDGYPTESLESILHHLKDRFLTYVQCGSEEFPHELGLFLGYPVEDVIGYMEHEGKEELYSGYWKVYSNLSEKQKLFEKYEWAKELLIHALSQGFEIQELIRMADLTEGAYIYG